MIWVIRVSHMKPVKILFAFCFPRFETCIKFMLSFAKSTMAPQASIYYLVSVLIRLIPR